jgi:hypothetical protein
MTKSNYDYIQAFNYVALTHDEVIHVELNLYPCLCHG